MRTKRSSAGCWYTVVGNISTIDCCRLIVKNGVFISIQWLSNLFKIIPSFRAIFFNTLIEKNPNDIRIPNKISNQIKPIKLKIQLYNPSSRIKNFLKKKKWNDSPTFNSKNLFFFVKRKFHHRMFANWRGAEARGNRTNDQAH